MLEQDSSHACNDKGRRRYQLGEATQVLCNGCKGELVLCATWAAQPEATKPEDAFEVGEQHVLSETAALYSGSMRARVMSPR
jgi:hypothetical protein